MIDLTVEQKPLQYSDCSRHQLAGKAGLDLGLRVRSRGSSADRTLQLLHAASAGWLRPQGRGVPHRPCLRHTGPGRCSHTGRPRKGVIDDTGDNRVVHRNEKVVRATRSQPRVAPSDPAPPLGRRVRPGPAVRFACKTDSTRPLGYDVRWWVWTSAASDAEGERFRHTDLISCACQLLLTDSAGLATMV